MLKWRSIMVYRCSKLFQGYSTCFRQWRATSHCRFLHGYSLKFKATFEGDLDDRNWVMDFGSFQPIKEKLNLIFDHTTIIASDDPEIERFRILHKDGIIDLRTMDQVGCEMFAKVVFDILQELDTERTRIISVECIENDTNIASYTDKIL